MDGSEWKSGWVLKDLLSGNFINAVGYVIRKSVLDEVGAFDEHSLLEDWDLWIRIAEKYPIGFLDKPWCITGSVPVTILPPIPIIWTRGPNIFLRNMPSTGKSGMPVKNTGCTGCTNGLRIRPVSVISNSS